MPLERVVGRSSAPSYFSLLALDRGELLHELRRWQLANQVQVDAAGKYSVAGDFANLNLLLPPVIGEQQINRIHRQQPFRMSRQHHLPRLQRHLLHGLKPKTIIPFQPLIDPRPQHPNLLFLQPRPLRRHHPLLLQPRHQPHQLALATLPAHHHRPILAPLQQQLPRLHPQLPLRLFPRMALETTAAQNRDDIAVKIDRLFGWRWQLRLGLFAIKRRSHHAATEKETDTPGAVVSSHRRLQLGPRRPGREERQSTSRNQQELARLC